MKRILFIFVMFLYLPVYCQGIYFSEPTSTHVDTVYGEYGQGPIAYNMYNAAYLYVYDFYARLTYPDNSQSNWQVGETGGWWVTNAGTYQIEGRAWAENVSGGSAFWAYRPAFSFNVVYKPAPQPLSSVYITGNSTLYPEQTGQWVANKVDGISPFSYSWEIMYVGDSEPLQESISEKGNKKKNGDDIIIEAAPSNDWVPIGSNSESFSKTYNPYDLRDFYLRCTVTDNTSTTKTSPAFFVDVVTQQQNIVQVDNYGIEAKALTMNDNMKQTSLSATETIPESFALAQNYPNPFNPTTNINYSIPESGFVTLKVYDMLGREVVELVNGNKSAGQYTIEFNASGLPSGTYVYKLSVGNYTQVKKMSLLK